MYPRVRRLKYEDVKDLVEGLNTILKDFREQRTGFDFDIDREATDFETALVNAISKGMTLQTILHLKIGEGG